MSLASLVHAVRAALNGVSILHEPCEFEDAEFAPLEIPTLTDEVAV